VQLTVPCRPRALAEVGGSPNEPRLCRSSLSMSRSTCVASGTRAGRWIARGFGSSWRWISSISAAHSPTIGGLAETWMDDLTRCTRQGIQARYPNERARAIVLDERNDRACVSQTFGTTLVGGVAGLGRRAYRAFLPPRCLFVAARDAVMRKIGDGI
jgi:hypothetical protein